MALTAALATSLDKALSTLATDRVPRETIEVLVAELTSRGAAKTAHSRRTFLHHLVGTWRILFLWNQPEHLCRAGLFHSIYGTQYFTTSTYSARAERDRIRLLVGDHAEELAFLFCTLDRRHLRGAARELSVIPEEGVTLRTVHDGDEVRVPPLHVAELLMLEAANVAEQVAAPGGGPSPWLAAATPLVRLARTQLSFGDVLPAGIDGLTVEREARAQATYESALDADGEDAAERAARAACSDNPWVGEPRLLLALAEIERRDARSALTHVDAALQLLVGWGTSWDKRAVWQRWLASALSARANACDLLGETAAARDARALSGAFLGARFQH